LFGNYDRGRGGGRGKNEERRTKKENGKGGKRKEGRGKNEKGKLKGDDEGERFEF
jgi:hypothetical protein